MCYVRFNITFLLFIEPNFTVSKQQIFGSKTSK